MPQKAPDETPNLHRDRAYLRHRGLAMKRRPYYVAKHWWQRSRMALDRTKPYSWSGVRVLAYHRVSEDDDELAVSPARFKRHMEALGNADVTVVDVDEALKHLNDRANGRYVCITFDDGYRDNLEHAAPVLERLGFPMRIYLATAVIDGEAQFDWYETQPAVLSWDEIRDMNNSELFSFGAQTRTHPVLPALTDDDAWEEIFGSKRDLEERLGSAITGFCYPGGLFRDRELEYVRRAGYVEGVTCEPGVNTDEQPRESWRRTMIDRRDTARDFIAKIAGSYDRPSALRTWLLGRRMDA
jgi:peptidoglycan/xylan/chitin deacetylase (PgdA/CDA1 family)